MNRAPSHSRLSEIILTPAFWLMARLSYFHKGALLFIVFIVLLFGTGYFYIGHLDEQIHSDKERLHGITVNKALFELLYRTERFREHGYLCLEGGCVIKEPLLLRGLLDESLASIDTLLRAGPYHTTMSPSLQGLSQDIEEADRAIKEQDPARYFEKMSAIVDDIIALMAQISLRSILWEAEDIEMLLGIQAVFDRLPRITALTGELRGMGSAIIHHGNSDIVSYSHVVDVMSEIERDRVELSRRIEGLTRQDTKIAEALEALIASLRTFDNWIERDILEGQMSHKAEAFFKEGTKVLATQKRLFDLARAHIEQKIHAKIETVQSRREMVIDMLLLVSLVWLYLFLGSYIVIRRSMDVLIDVTDEVASGEMQTRMPRQSNEEFDHIAYSMNHMISSLHNSSTLLIAYKRALDEATLISKTDAEGVITYINPTYEHLCGYTLKEVIGKTNGIFRSPNTSADQVEEVWDTILAKQSYHGIFENVAKDGSRFFVKSTIVPILDENETIIEFVAIMSDITMLVAREHELEERLYTDDLTGLPNRAALHEAIRKVKDAKLLLLDIDGLSKINTFYGESVGDEVILRLAERLQEMREDSTLQLFHLASDEFAMLADANLDIPRFQEDVVMLAHALNPIRMACLAHEITVRVSIGAVIASRNDAQRSLLAMASMALAEAKKRPRSYFYYSDISDPWQKIEASLGTIERLDYAIKHKSIIAHYQPIYNVKSERVEKFEGLMRLVDTEGKIHAPDTFIDVAKGARLYGRLTEQIVTRTLRMAELNPELEFSINIDLDDIKDTGTSRFIIDQLHHSTSTERIMFELVETADLEKNEIVRAFLLRLKGLGCKVAIDDFGSGYSNYAYLLELGIDIVKIDGTLIDEIDRDEDKQRIVASIISIVHELGMQVVTEYVNRRAVYDTVVELGADYVQGVYIAAAAAELRVENSE